MVCLTKEMPQMDKSCHLRHFGEKDGGGFDFCAFSCKLKSNHAFVDFAAENAAKYETHGTKTAKDNGA